MNGGPKTEVTLPDPAPPPGSTLRPALWHAAALLSCGYRVAAHEFKHDASGQCWRTWHVSLFPIQPQSDPVLATGSSQLMDMLDSGLMLMRHPGCGYMAAYHGARNLDILRAYMAAGGPVPITVAVQGGRSPLAMLVPSTGKAEAISLGEMIRGQHVCELIRDLDILAALVTLGFPFMGIGARTRRTEGGLRREEGPVVMAHAVPSATGEVRQAQYGESVTAPALPLGAAVAGVHAIREQTAAALLQIISDGAQDPKLESPLDPGHALHWAAAGAIRREHLRAVEAQLGHDASSLRSHILQGKSRTPGHAVITTQDEYRANESAIIRHLRRFG